jgi:hypothetical protein
MPVPSSWSDQSRNSIIFTEISNTYSNIYLMPEIRWYNHILYSHPDLDGVQSPRSGGFIGNRGGSIVLTHISYLRISLTDHCNLRCATACRKI